jgi:hypothetical protein
MASKVELAEKKDDYNNLLANAITSIRVFQNIDVVSIYFHFLIQCNEYDLSKQQCKDLIERNYPLIRKLGNNFNSNYILLQSCLQKIRVNATEQNVKSISAYLNTEINRLTKDIEVKALTDIISGQYHNAVFYTSANHDGLIVRQVKENVWEDFNLSLLKENSLLEGYRGLLLELVDLLKKLIKKFQKNKWISAPKKSTPNYERNYLNLKNVIDENKWSDFISHCDYYCQEQLILSKPMKLITKVLNAKETYHWKLKADKSSPQFAAFVKRLVDKKYILNEDIPLIDLFKPFLFFFTKKEYKTSEANDIAKYYNGSRKNNYLREFDRIR